MPRPPAPHGTTNRWRTGCRCTDCGHAHNADTGGQVRARADAAFPAQTRRRVLKLIAAGHSPADVAARLDLHPQTIYARRRWDIEWAAQLDEALMAGRDPAGRHGTAAGYRWDGCRCPECKAAHHLHA